MTDLRDCALLDARKTLLPPAHGAPKGSDSCETHHKKDKVRRQSRATTQCVWPMHCSNRLPPRPTSWGPLGCFFDQMGRTRARSPHRILSTPRCRLPALGRFAGNSLSDW